MHGPSAVGERALNVSVGWVLGNAREHARDPALRVAATFAQAITPTVHRSQIGRWEAGVTQLTYEQVRQYEIVLELPEGHLLAAIDTLARAEHRVLAGPWLPPPRNDPWWSDSMSLIERADSPERLTGAQWSTLTANLGSDPDAMLRQRDWDMLLRRCSLEAGLRTGLEFILRDEATARIAGHPRGCAAVVDLVDETLSNPTAAIYSEAAALLSHTPDDRGLGVLLRHLPSPVNESALWTILWALLTLMRQGRLSSQQSVDVGVHAVGLLQDASVSTRVHRAAANLVHAIDPPERERVSAGLRASSRRRIARIVDQGGALAKDELALMAREIRTRMAMTLGPRAQLAPTLKQLITEATSVTGEDSRGKALTVLMLTPQGPAIGATYAATLRWARRNGHEELVDEALSVLSWLLPPADLPTLLEVAADPVSSPVQVLQALVAVGNCRPASAAATSSADIIATDVRDSALRAMTASVADPDSIARGHLYVLGMYGRADLVATLVKPSRRRAVPLAWTQSIEAWTVLPPWAWPSAD